MRIPLLLPLPRWRRDSWPWGALVLLPLLLSGAAHGQALTISSLSPTRNLRNAARTTDVAVTFSRTLTNNATSQQAVRVFSQQRGGRMYGSTRGTTAVSGSTITFNPATNFQPGEKIFVTTTPPTPASGQSLARGLVHQFTAAAGVGPGTFGGGTSVSVGAGPRGVVTADVDNDGDPDMLIANRDDGTVSVRLNTGNGTFNGTQSVGAGTMPFTTVMADVDGDGDLDLLVSNIISDDVSVRLNNGGVFTGTQNVSVGSLPVGLAVGDIDGDGDLDLVTANEDSHNASVRFNNGSGTFSGSQTVSVDPGPRCVVLGDVDADGDLDLLTGSFNSNLGNVVSLRLNNGSGVFGGTTSISVAGSVIGIALGDVDADGDLDLLTSNLSARSLSVRVNSGTGVFSGSQNLNLNGGGNLVLGDVDGDGDLDALIAIGASNAVKVCYNNGAGVYGNPQSVSMDGQASGVALADLDGDDDLDLMTANSNLNTVNVRLNIPLPTLTSLAPGTGIVGGTVTLSGTNLTGATAVRFNGTAATSFTVSSATQITATVPTGATTGSVTVTTPNGTSNGLTFTVITPPANDEPSAAVALTVASTCASPLNGTTVGASRTTTAGVSSGNYDVFYQFVAGTSPITLQAQAATTGQRVKLTLYSGTATNLQLVQTATPSYPPTTANAITTLATTGLTAGATYYVQVQTLSDVVGIYDAAFDNFTICAYMVAPAPTLTSIAPSSGPVGSNLTLTGTGLTGATQITFAGTSNNTITSGFVVNAAGTQISGVTVPSGVVQGLVTVTTPGGTTNGVAFTVTPTISSVTPLSGPAGTTVTLTGTGLVGTSVVLFGSPSSGIAGNNPQVNSTGTTLTFQVPSSAVSGPFTVTLTSGQQATSTQRFVAAPVIQTLSGSSSATAGDSRTITGVNFDNASSLTVGGVAATITANTSTSVTFTVPPTATNPAVGGATIGLTTPGGSTTTTSLTLNIYPRITSFSPAAATVGSTVTLTGTGFTLASLGTVRLGSCNPATNLTVVSPTQATAVVPATACAGPVNYNGINSPTSATFTLLPTISSVAPGSGLIGTQVVVDVSGNYNLTTGQVSFQFNGTPAPVFTQSGPSQYTVTIPAGATTGLLTFITPNGTSNGQPFTVIAPPANDEPATAVALPVAPTCASPVSGTIANATPSTTPGLNGSVKDVFYRFTATGLSTTVEVTDAAVYPQRAVIELYTGTTTLSRQITSGSGNTSTASFETFSTMPGSSYLVRVYYPSATTQQFTVCAVGYSQPANDDPAGAHLLTVGGTCVATAGTTNGASRTTITGVTQSPADVFYRFVAGANDVGLAAQTVLSGQRVRLALYSGTATNLQLVQTITPSYPPTSANATTTFTATGLTAGATYYVQVITLLNGAGGYTASNAATDFTLCAYTPPPVLSNLTPSSGPVGTVVTLAGTNLAGATAVRFNGTAATSFTVVSATSITTTVPAGATTGNVTVTTPSGISNGISFVVRNAPMALTLSNNTVAENAGTPATVGIFTTSDPDVGDTFTYSLVSGPGSADNAAFSISGGTLRLNAPADYETQASYAVRVRTTDGSGLFTEQPFTITVTNVNEAPTALTLSNTTVAENTGANVVVGTLSTTDPDAGDAFTYTLVSGPGSADNAWVNINGDQLRITASPDFETKNTYAVRVRATDAGGLGFEQAFTLTVTDVVEGGTITGFTPTSGAPSTVVTLTGTNFTGATAVTFNGVPATSFTVNSATQITVSVPVGASTGMIVVQTPAGAYSSTTTFLVNAVLLIYDTPHLIPSGNYGTISIYPGASASLAGDISVVVSFLVQNGATFDDNCRLIGGGGTFTVAPGGTLRICHPLGISASGATGAVQTTGARLFAVGGNYVYDGSSSQQAGSGLPTSAGELIVENPQGLTLTQDVSISKRLVLAGSGDLRLNGSALTLLSKAPGAAGGSALVVNQGTGQVVGNATVQVWLPSAGVTGLVNRHLNSPVAGLQVADLTTLGGTFTPVVNPAFNTTPSPSPANVMPYPTVFGFDESRAPGSATYADGYFSPALTDALAPARGVVVMAVGNAAETFVFNGPLLSGDQTATGLTRTGSFMATNEKSGWNLLGNPFPSPLNWDLVPVPAGLSASISVWQPTGNNTGVYLTRAAGTGSLTSGIVPIGQAFLVRVTGTGPLGLTLPQAARVTTWAATPNHYRPAPDQRPLLSLKLRQADSVAHDETFVYFQSGASTGLDAAFDGLKPGHNVGVPTLATLIDGTEAAVNGLPLEVLTGPATVELLAALPAAGAYTLVVGELQNFGRTAVTLLDRLTDTRYDLTQQSTITFQVAQAGIISGRFALVFNGQRETGTSDLVLRTSRFTLWPNPARGTARLNGVAGTVQLLDATGRVLRTVPAPAETLDLTGLPAGVYLVRCGAQTQRLVVE